MPAVILDADALLTVDEAARHLGLAPKTVRNWVYTGRIGSKRIGRCLRIPAGDVRRVLDEAPATARITAQNGGQ